MQGLTSASEGMAVWAWIGVALLFGGICAAGALARRRQRLTRLYRRAQYLHQEIAFPRQGVSMTEVTEDYDAVCFAYNVVRELPLSRIAARRWPMLAWSARVLREAAARRSAATAQAPASAGGRAANAPATRSNGWPRGPGSLPGAAGTTLNGNSAHTGVGLAHPNPVGRAGNRTGQPDRQRSWEQT